MSSALVVGGRGSGVSTFLGLLYTAEVRLGCDLSDEFRFHVDRASIRRLEGIYGELGDGRFPESEIDWARTPLTFLVDDRRFGRRHRPPAPGAELELSPFWVEIGGLSTEEAAELAERDAVLDATLRRLLRSRIVLPLVDATNLPAAEGDPAPRLAVEDRRLARTLELIVRYLSTERRRRARRLFPLFVLTKCDRLPGPAARRLAAPPGPPASWSHAAREEFGSRLLAAYLPETARALERAADRGVEVARPSWFFSEVGTEGGDGRRIRRRWKDPSGGWEPEYPYEEYRALLDRLGDLAHRLPDPGEP